jgi:hypothetical protein
VQDDPKSGQPKTQRADANLDRVRTLVRPERRLGVGLTAEQLIGNLVGGKDQNSGLKNGFPTLTTPPASFGSFQN